MRLVVCMVACVAAMVVAGAAPAQARVPRLHHVWVFVMENHSLGQILGNRQAPFLNRLARRYRVATRFYAPMHPSLPNYLAMISGSTQGCTSDDCKPGYGGAAPTRPPPPPRLCGGGVFVGPPPGGG